jgi:N-dimethylarginine dimethylaminohydrolase
MVSGFGSQSMIAPLRRVVVKRPKEAFRSREEIERDWKALGYTRAPSLDRAGEEHQRLIRMLEGAGVEVLCLPQDARTGMDSIYTHDPVLITDGGAVILQMGKPARQGEGPAFADALRYWGVPILGTLEGDATAKAVILLWLDPDTLLAGRSFRTNSAGIEALRAILGPIGVDVVEVHLPAFRGPAEILHLQSLISLLDERLAVVYRPLLPVP